MGRKRRYYGRGRGGIGPVFAIAVGIGMILAMCFSVKLSLFLAAVILIYIGATYSS